MSLALWDETRNLIDIETGFFSDQIALKSMNRKFSLKYRRQNMIIGRMKITHSRTIGAIAPFRAQRRRRGATFEAAKGLCYLHLEDEQEQDNKTFSKSDRHQDVRLVGSLRNNSLPQSEHQTSPFVAQH